MKQIFAGTLVCALLLLLTACNDNSISHEVTSSSAESPAVTAAASGTMPPPNSVDLPKPDSLSDYPIYPKNADKFIPDFDQVPEPPESIFSSPASENGCGGTTYKIYGQVISFEEAAPSNSYYDVITLQTDCGKMCISNLFDDMCILMPELNRDDLHDMFSLPQIGEWVCVYCEYQGFSSVLDAPSSTLGNEDTFYYAYDFAENGNMSDAEREIKAVITQVIEDNSANVTIDRISLNENLGTSSEGDYIAFVYLTFNPLNDDPQFVKTMLSTYSFLYSSQMGETPQSVSELCLFWTVPSYSYTDTAAKYSYTRNGNYLAASDQIVMI